MDMTARTEVGAGHVIIIRSLKAEVESAADYNSRIPKWNSKTSLKGAVRKDACWDLDISINDEMSVAVAGCGVEQC